MYNITKYAGEKGRASLDFFTFPDPSESMLYGYIIILIVFVAASVTLRRLKKANEKQAEKEKKHKMIENSEQDKK